MLPFDFQSFVGSEEEIKRVTNIFCIVFVGAGVVTGCATFLSVCNFHFNMHVSIKINPKSNFLPLTRIEKYNRK